MQRILRQIPFWSVLAFITYMPFHIFLSQWLSLATGGLEAWKLGKDAVLCIVVVFSICLVYQQRRATKLFSWLVGATLLYGALHIVVWLMHPAIFTDSAILGVIYNNRLLAFLVVGMAAVLLSEKREILPRLSLLVRWTIGVSTVVACLAILQYFLPKDILTHFGYGLDRGVRPNFFIDDNPLFPRVMSTLRDPNSLGAYLIVPLAILATYITRLRDYTGRRQTLLLGVAVVHVTALYLTFSRSAWLAAAVTIGLVLWWRVSSQFVYILRRWWYVAVVVVVIAGGTLFGLRHTPLVDGVLTHSTSAQVGEYDSNEYHVLYVERGLTGIWHKPFGHGPGTAGLASIQNPHGGLLTENYYVQIGYEVGVLGLMLFVAVSVGAYIRLRQRHNSLGVTLLASFWGYVVMNMLLHTWSNEAVAAQWWLLAGVAIALPVSRRQPKRGGRSAATTSTADDAA